MTLIRLQNLVPPPKFAPIIRYLGRTGPIRILDIGVANGSAQLAKHWFPNCHYHGGDITDTHLLQDERKLMDAFSLVGTNGIQGYDQFPDQSFDVVILNHVLEHLSDPLNLVHTAVSKLKSGGIIFAAFPGIRSLALPSGEGTLHFCDDPTHVSAIDLISLVNCLLRLDVKIIFAGATRDVCRYLIGLCLLPWAFIRRLITGRWQARGLWYVLGFEESIVGIKRAPF